MDFLIPGYKVLSNMSIKWGIKVGDYVVGYASQELDKAALLSFDIESNCCVVIDEVNIEFSEARRSMTNRNLIFNKILQQLRKRKLNVVYTVQHEMWIDNRLRGQTDVFIKCRDKCLQDGGWFLPYDYGEQINWCVYDMRGIYGHGSYDDTQIPLLDGVTFFGKKWWHSFNTDQLQGDEEVYGQQRPPTDITKWSWVYSAIQELVSTDRKKLSDDYEMKEIDFYDYLSKYQSFQPGDWREIRKYLRDGVPLFCRSSGGQNYFQFASLVEKYDQSVKFPIEETGVRVR